MPNKIAIATPTAEPSAEVPYATPAPALGPSCSSDFRNCFIVATAFFVVGVGGTLLWYYTATLSFEFTVPPPAYNVSACQACAQFDNSSMTISEYYSSTICPNTTFPGHVDWIAMKHISSTCCCPTSFSHSDGYGLLNRDSFQTASATCSCSFKIREQNYVRLFGLLVGLGAVFIVSFCWCCVLLCQATCCTLTYDEPEA